MRPITGIAILAMASLLAVSACTGSGRDGSDREPVTDPDPIVDPDPDPDPRDETASPGTVTSVRSARATEIVNTSAQAAVSPPRAGSVYQSAAEGVAGVSGIGTSFDGADLTLSVSRQDGSSISVESDHAYLGPYDFVSPIVGHTKIREWGVAQTDGQGISIGRVLVSWDEGDSTDYLAGGYWMHLEGDVDALDFDGIEIGAFVDGPELSSPPNMPVQGSASYLGVTGGIYSAVHGTDTGVTPGSLEIGEFSSTLELNADFAARTIGGCVGCGDEASISISSVVEDAATGEVEEFYVEDSGYELALGPTSFDSNGAFVGQQLSLSSEHLAITSTDGYWGGQFSSIPNSSTGNPRAVAGTFGAVATSSGDSEGVFLGSYAASGGY